MIGIYSIYKPVGPTSFGIISELRKITGVRRIGHAGTLDPLAKGVLVVAIGAEYTKKLDEIVAKEKEYIADIRLGATSTTDDEEGDKQKVESNKQIGINDIEKVISGFIGQIEQVPPIYSAIKMGGKRAYDLARKGKAPLMSARPVEIKEIELLSYKWPDLKLRVTTGKGVYIRSLARDVGKALGVGGYLAGLERTRVGQYKKGGSLTVEEFASKFKNDKFEN